MIIIQVFSFIWLTWWIPWTNFFFHWRINLAFLEYTQLLHNVLHVWYVPGFVVPIHFVKCFCIYVHEWGWVVIFFFFNFFVVPDLVLPSKWGQFHKMSWGLFPPLHFLLRVYINWNHWFLKYLIELPFQIIWFYCFPYEKTFNHWFNFLNG